MPMPRTGLYRFTKYSVKLDPATIASRFTQVKDLALDLAQEGLTKYAALDDIVSGILDTHGIVGNARVVYRNFARIVMKNAERFSGEALAKKLAGEKQKFIVAYGLDPVILDKIIEAVTGLTAPTAT
jgi:Sulfolobus virus coat protein C terminal.